MQWVILIKILKHQQLLWTWKRLKEVTVDQVVELLAAAAGAEKGPARRCLEAALQQRGAVSVLVDGVDEVAPAYKELTMRLLEKLLDQPVRHAWVSSRPEVEASLCSVLRTPSLALEPFTPQEQEKYLCSRMTSVKDADRKLKVEKIMEMMKKTGNLLENPLHLYMTSEIFNEDTDMDFNSKFTLLTLYENFIKKKREQFKIKYSYDPENLPSDDFEMKHQKCALVFLFMDAPERKYFSIEEYKEFVNNDKTLLRASEKFGIVWLDKNKRLNFIHQTFAEYFAAKWLFENAKKMEGARNIVLEALDPKRGESRMQMFLLEMLAEKWPLHAAACRADVREMERLMEDEGWGDEGDRWEEKDSLLGWTWGQYVELARNKYKRINYIKGCFDILLLMGKGETAPCDMWRCISLHAGAITGCHTLVDQVLLRWKIPPSTLQRALVVSTRGKEEGNYKIVQKLLSIETEYWKKFSETLVHEAAQGGNVATVALLLGRFPNHANARNFRKETPLNVASSYHHHDVVQFLSKEEIVEVEVHDIYGRTPLCHVAAADCVSCAESLLRRKARIDGGSEPPLSVAARKNRINMLRYLLDNGADINAKDLKGNTALHNAVMNAQTQGAQALLQNGADWTLRNNEGETALDIACKDNTTEIWEMLLEHMIRNALTLEERDMKIVLLKKASRIGSKEKVLKILLSDTFSPSELSEALLVAAKGELRVHTAIVRILLDKGAEANRFKEEESPLHYAARANNAETISLLLERSADANARNSHGQTPLLVAMGSYWEGHSYKAIQRLLQEESVDVNAEDNRGRRPLDAALNIQCLSCVKLLMERGAKTAEILLGKWRIERCDRCH